MRLVPIVANVGALANRGGGPKHPFFLRPAKERVAPMKRILVLMTATAMMAAMIAIPGVALAQGGDVCFIKNGETKVQKGTTSSCTTDSTSTAFALKDSDATAFSGSKARAIKGSEAFAVVNSEATATNDSEARAEGSSEATATNDSVAQAIHNSEATATNDSFAIALDNSEATASSDSDAFAFNNCTATAHNGEVESCP